MTAVRALQRRVAKLEMAARPRPSPFQKLFGSIDDWVDQYVIPDVEAGRVCTRDMVDIVAVFRRWEEDGTWDKAH